MTARSASTRNLLTLAAAALFCVLPLRAQQAPTHRDISGTVTDTSHEPLRGAVVELHNPATNAVISRLTDAAGHYDFKHLDGDTDFTVTAAYRGHTAHPHTISKFDSHLDAHLDFTIKTY
jgi:hypothetical protein